MYRVSINNNKTIVSTFNSNSEELAIEIGKGYQQLHKAFNGEDTTIKLIKVKNVPENLIYMANREHAFVVELKLLPTMSGGIYVMHSINLEPSCSKFDMYKSRSMGFNNSLTYIITIPTKEVAIVNTDTVLLSLQTIGSLGLTYDQTVLYIDELMKGLHTNI